MNKFKPGDYVVPVRVMRTDDAVVQELGNQVGKVLQVLTVFQGIGLSVFAGKPKSEAWSWHPAELRLATAEEIEAATKSKPLRQGDLVDYSGNICMVFDERTSKRGERLIVVLNSKDRMDSFYAYVDDLVCVGSIRKQLKRAKKKVECAK